MKKHKFNHDAEDMIEALGTNLKQVYLVMAEFNMLCVELGTSSKAIEKIYNNLISKKRSDYNKYLGALLCYLAFGLEKKVEEYLEIFKESEGEIDMKIVNKIINGIRIN